MSNEAYIDQDGVARWTSNKRVVPSDCIDRVLALPGFDFKATYAARDKETQETLNAYRRNRETHGYSSEELTEAYHELGPTAVDVITGKRLFPNGKTPFSRPVSTIRRERAANTLGKIEKNATVTFPYNGQNFTATVDKINTTTATVTITKVEGRSNNPRQRPILPGAKGVRVPASILARSL